MLLLPHKKMQRRLREELDRLYEHLDNTGFSGPEVGLLRDGRGIWNGVGTSNFGVGTGDI